MRVLHLIDSGFRAPSHDRSDRGLHARAWTDLAVASAALVIRRSAHDHSVCFLGPRSALDRAARAGLNADLAIAPTLGMPAFASSPLRRWAERRRFDILQCWSPAAAACAPDLLDSGGGRTVTLTPAGDPAPASCGSLVTFTAAAADRAQRLSGAARISIISPPRLNPPDTLARLRIRRELGLENDEPAILLLGSAPNADALRFTFLINLIAVAGCAATGILPTSAAQVLRAERFVKRIGRNRIILTDRPAPDLLAAADLAVFDVGGHGPTTILPPAPWASGWAIGHAHAAGVPTVAPRWADDGWLYPREAAPMLLTHNSSLPELARVLMGLVESPRRLALAASAVRAHFPAADEAFCAALEGLWRDLAADRPPAITEPAEACTP